MPPCQWLTGWQGEAWQQKRSVLIQLRESDMEKLVGRVV